MKITVIGGQWLGLVVSGCYSEFGFSVELIDENEERIDNLKNNITNLYEPGLESLLRKNNEKGTLNFSTKINNFTQESDAIIISIDTIGKDGSDMDLSKIYKTVNEISLSLRRDKYTAIIIKSITPIGTCSTIKRTINFMRPDLTEGEHYDIISNPDFFREGSAIRDFLIPDRVIIGVDNESKKAKALILKLYEAIITPETPIISTDLETGELIRHSTTAFVLSKIALMNELSDLCDRVGTDINKLIKGLGVDSRIGPKWLSVIPGVGGASVIRTARTLLNTAENLGCDLKILKGALDSNSNRVFYLIGKIRSYIEDSAGIEGKKLTILGLAFRSQTDDIVESASIHIIKELLKLGAEILLYDPAYKANSANLTNIPKDIINNEKFVVTSSVYEAANQSDALIIMTSWMEFREIDFYKICELMNKKDGKKPIIIDFTNMFSKDELQNFKYISYGNIN